MAICQWSASTRTMSVSLTRSRVRCHATNRRWKWDGDKSKMIAQKALMSGLAVVLVQGSTIAADIFGLLPQRTADATVMSPPKSTANEQLPLDLDPDELQSVKLFKQNTPTVVNITNLQDPDLGPGPRAKAEMCAKKQMTSVDYYTLDTYQMPVGTGSGFIWDQKGHVITNYHVIRGAKQVQVTLLDKRTVTAKVVGADADKDIAVLQLNLPDEDFGRLASVEQGASGNLVVGQKVYAIGNPFGLDHTLTQGIISGLGRQLETGYGPPLKNLIQTDAAINPGNSGGVLLNSRGRIIGINTAIADPTGKGSSSGVGFAIPIDNVRGLVDQILTYGRVMRPYLGVTLAPPTTLKQLNLQGVLILEVPEDGPAAAAGLRPTSRAFNSIKLGDIIVEIDGKKVRNQSDLFDLLDSKKVGEKAKVVALRQANAGNFENFERVETTVQLGERRMATTD